MADTSKHQTEYDRIKNLGKPSDALLNQVLEEFEARDKKARAPIEDYLKNLKATGGTPDETKKKELLTQYLAELDKIEQNLKAIVNPKIDDVIDGIKDPSDKFTFIMQQFANHTSGITEKHDKLAEDIYKSTPDIDIRYWDASMANALHKSFPPAEFERYAKHYPIEYLYGEKTAQTGFPKIDITVEDIKAQLANPRRLDEQSIEKCILANPNHDLSVQLIKDFMEKNLGNDKEARISEKLHTFSKKNPDLTQPIREISQYAFEKILATRPITERDDDFLKMYINYNDKDPNFLSNVGKFSSLYMKTDKSIASSARTLLALADDNPSIRPILSKLNEEYPIIGIMAKTNTEELDDPKISLFHNSLYQKSTAGAMQVMGTSEEVSLVQIINDLHESPDNVRFAVFKNANAQNMYDLLSRNSGFYTSSFHHAFDTLIERLKSEKKEFLTVALSTKESKENLGDFLSLAGEFDRLKDLIQHNPKLPQIAADTLIDNKNKEEKADGAKVSNLINILKNTDNNNPSLPYIEQKIIDTYKNGSNIEKAEMGVLANWYATQSGHTPTQEHKAFFKQMSENDDFKIKNIKTLQPNDLLDASKINYQTHIFYNDEDGINSFNSFSSAMKKDGWAFKKQDDFIIASKGKNGTKIEMLVSPPEADGEAVSKINKYLSDKNAESSILVHRGHSYHVDESIKNINEHHKVVFLGSCGGYTNIDKVLELSQEAQILSTSKTGKMDINNPTLIWLNNQILDQKPINWRGLENLWDKLEKNKSLEGDAHAYKSPNDISLRIFNKLNELDGLIQNGKFNPPTTDKKEQLSYNAPVAAFSFT